MIEKWMKCEHGRFAFECGVCADDLLHDKGKYKSAPPTAPSEKRRRDNLIDEWQQRLLAFVSTVHRRFR